MKDMLATAQKVLGYDLLKLCLEGPKEKLDDTTFRCRTFGLRPWLPKASFAQKAMVACLCLKGLCMRCMHG